MVALMADNWVGCLGESTAENLAVATAASTDGHSVALKDCEWADSMVSLMGLPSVGLKVVQKAEQTVDLMVLSSVDLKADKMVVRLAEPLDILTAAKTAEYSVAKMVSERADKKVDSKVDWRDFWLVDMKAVQSECASVDQKAEHLVAWKVVNLVVQTVL